MQMDLDLLLAIAHHLPVFTLVAIFAAEWALLRPGLSPSQLRPLARLDLSYGIVAGIVIAVGVVRAIFAAKGWDYYASNHAFWGKMTAFLLMGLLSIPPTLAIRRWAANSRANPGAAVPPAELMRSRRFLHLQALALLFVPVFAAMMARGYGS